VKGAEGHVWQRRASGGAASPLVAVHALLVAVLLVHPPVFVVQFRMRSRAHAARNRGQPDMSAGRAASGAGTVAAGRTRPWACRARSAGARFRRGRVADSALKLGAYACGALTTKTTWPSAQAANVSIPGSRNSARGSARTLPVPLAIRNAQVAGHTFGLPEPQLRDVLLDRRDHRYPGTRGDGEAVAQSRQGGV
jgi:hypothetical protein